MIKNLIKKVIPKRTWNNFRDNYYINFKNMINIRKRKSPKYIWGYKDSDGSWNPRTRISDTVYIGHPERITIKDNVFIGHYSILDGIGGIEIGKGAVLSAWVGVFTHSAHIAIRLYGNHYTEIHESEKKAYHVKPVKIGKYVFIGAQSLILPGVVIGDGAIISAGSIVKENVDMFSRVSGNPAKVIGNTKDLDKKYLDDPQMMEWYKEWQEDKED
jgi:acetyltransferase-like isoleucine patch superfamily enzyme